LSEAALKELVMPQKGELLGRVIKLVGGDNIIVKCTDGKVRTCRIRGKIKRRMWIRDNDLVLIAPWDFQSDKADIVWRYIAAHADKLEQDGYLTNLGQMDSKVIVI
jgi:translation initiation factor 1A